jgi:hypothetical protein
MYISARMKHSVEHEAYLCIWKEFSEGNLKVKVSEDEMYVRK